MRELGGEITCDSEWGVGTTFTFIVKLMQRSIFCQDQEDESRLINPYVIRAVPRVSLEEELIHLGVEDDLSSFGVQLGNGGTFVDCTAPSNLELPGMISNAPANEEESKSVENSGLDTARLSQNAQELVEINKDANIPVSKSFFIHERDLPEKIVTD